MNIRATIVNLGDRSLPARDSLGRNLVVPRSSLAAAARGQTIEIGMTVIGQVTDDNRSRVRTMVRVDAVEPPKIEELDARIGRVVQSHHRFAYLDSGHGPETVFVHGGLPGFDRLQGLSTGAIVGVRAYYNADGKLTALALQFGKRRP